MFPPLYVHMRAGLCTLQELTITFDTMSLKISPEGFTKRTPALNLSGGNVSGAAAKSVSRSNKSCDSSSQTYADPFCIQKDSVPRAVSMSALSSNKYRSRIDVCALLEQISELYQCLRSPRTNIATQKGGCSRGLVQVLDVERKRRAV